MIKKMEILSVRRNKELLYLEVKTIWGIKDRAVCKWNNIFYWCDKPKELDYDLQNVLWGLLLNLKDNGLEVLSVKSRFYENKI